MVNAANAFKATGLEATEMYRSLLQASVETEAIPDAARLTNANKAVAEMYVKSNADADNRWVSSDQVWMALAKTSKTEIQTTIYKSFELTDSLVGDYAGSLKNLPDAVYIVKSGTKACITEMAARLTKDFVTMAKTLRKSPQPLRRRAGDLTGMINKALRAGDGPLVATLLGQMESLADEAERRNQETIAKLVEAAEKGAVAVDASIKFETFSTADLLALANKAVDIVEQSNVFTTGKVAQRLAYFESKFEHDGGWKKLLDKKYRDEDTACNPKTKEGA
ncbi:MAG: hypothetical protein CMM77_10170 [Rhodospirillaceae bacterium]|nr:hypothetical protein [Magnetovibrio sp.]MAY67481.1 hypothetical protein [Rhodospirillaceae bacterium]